MYYRKLKKLKDFEIKKDIIKKIDQIIASLPRFKRISFLLLSKRLKISKELSYNVALFCVEEGLMEIKYEITCPNCSSDLLSISNLSDIQKSEITCDICEEKFIPSENDLWIVLLSNKIPKIKRESYIFDQSTRFKDLKNYPLFIDITDNDFFNIDKNCFKDLIKFVEEAKTKNNKKKTLEDLGDYLFSCVSVFNVVERNIRTSTSELDLIVENQFSFHPFLHELGYLIPIECKNWNKPISSSEIRDFHGDISKRNMKCGILISKKGITGKKNKDAKGVIGQIFIKDKISILTLNLNDLKRITLGENLITILRKKYLELTLKLI